MLTEYKNDLKKRFEEGLRCDELLKLSESCSLTQEEIRELRDWVQALYIVLPKTNPDNKHSW